jgi:hypothetical protein
MGCFCVGHYVCVSTFDDVVLKVSTNEKRGGLKVVAFDRSPFKGIDQ